MNRQRDLDVIAPDDPIEETQTPIVQTIPKTKKITKTLETDPKSCYRKIPRIEEIINKTHGQFSTFVPKPKGFRFEECDECEEIIIVLRPHWFTNIKWIFLCALFLVLPSIITFFNARFFNNELFFGLIDNNNLIPENYKSIGMFFWYLFIFIFGFESFLSWYFDVYIITDKRVVDIHFNNLLDKKFSEANIEAIQDVTSRVSGLSQTILNYGDILIQTAGAQTELNFMKVPHPNAVTEIIQELRTELKQKASKGDSNE